MKPKDDATPVQDAGKDGAEGVQLSCKVLQGGLKIGNFKKGRGKEISLPKDQAVALQEAGLVKIQGPA